MPLLLSCRPYPRPDAPRPLIRRTVLRPGRVCHRHGRLCHTQPSLLQTRPSYNCPRFKCVEKHSRLSSFLTSGVSPSKSYLLNARRALPGGRGEGVRPHESHSLTNRLRATGYRLTYSSCSRSFAITEKSSSVVTSPLISPFVAISRSSRRIIFPDRVFGS